MKKIILSAFLLLPVCANASSITFSNSPVGPQVVSRAGALIGNGMLVRTGYFSDIANLATFVEFGTSVTASVAGGTSRVTGLVTNTGGEADDAQFNGRNVFIWVYNSPTVSLTADQGIFRASAAATPWLFPTDGGALDGVTLSVAAVDTALSPVGLSGAAILPVGAPGNPSPNVVFRLAAIPEPTTSLLLAVIGALGILRRKR